MPAKPLPKALSQAPWAQKTKLLETKENRRKESSHQGKQIGSFKPLAPVSYYFSLRNPNCVGSLRENKIKGWGTLRSI